MHSLYNIIVTCISNNNAAIKSNCGRLGKLVFLFTIPIGSRKNLFEVRIQFGHAISKCSSALSLSLPAPTMNPRKPRQASRRIRVRRHEMRIKVWIILGNMKMKCCWSSKFCSQSVRNRRCCRAPCNSTMLERTVRPDSYPFRIKIKYILQYWFHVFMPNFAIWLKVISNMNKRTEWQANEEMWQHSVLNIKVRYERMYVTE
jgi:hypothetical protein